MQFERRGCNLLHDHDSIEEARASDNAAGHEVGSAHLALHMQVWQFIHLHLTSKCLIVFLVRTQSALTDVCLMFVLLAMMLCKFGPACAADDMVGFCH